MAAAATGAAAATVAASAFAAAGAAVFGASEAAAVASLLITPITAPTCTTSPSLNRRFIKVPSKGEGISLSTLSVAISKTVSSILILSPSFLLHLIIVASATLSPILGMIKSKFAIVLF